MTSLFLASTSPARKKILEDLGLHATVLRPDLDEELAVTTMEQAKTPENIALYLARLKAESAVGPEISGLIIGGDSVFHFRGENYGKPHTPEVARARWLDMVGQQGTLYSGLWLIDCRDGVSVASTGEVSHATLHFSPGITPDEIDAYVATGEPLRVAGAFTLDGRGGALIDRVEGDPHAVVGMSGASLRRLILSLGHSYHELWRS